MYSTYLAPLSYLTFGYLFIVQSLITHTMKVLLVGSGGREHAIAMAIAQSSDEPTLYAAMKYKNPGIAHLCKDYVLVSETDIQRVADYAERVDLAIIGPEAPLAEGIVDALTSRGVRAFGPTQQAARIESDKSWARSFMTRHDIAGCPQYALFEDVSEADSFLKDHIDEGNLVIKPIGLTGGKGVVVIDSYEEGRQYLKTLRGPVIIEECLKGEEFTIQAFVDGRVVAPGPAVQDHKRAFEGDRGPNTGGMGSYTDKSWILPFMDKNDYDAAITIMQDTVDALRAGGVPYKGILYGQFMLTKRGPMVVEYNCRFGDPEAMNVLPLLKSDFVALAESAIDGTLKKADYNLHATVCKYVVPAGYPSDPQPTDITIDQESMDALLFYASVNEHEGRIATTTSRALAVLGIDETIERAEEKAEQALHHIHGNVFARHDIGTAALVKSRLEHMKQIRAS
ncbi:MAG: phosphoribosylamine--glycine ligase [Halobacteriota archaeon]